MTIYRNVPQPHIEVIEDSYDETRIYGVRICESNKKATFQMIVDRTSKQERKKAYPFMEITFNEENTKQLYLLFKKVFDK